jgi:cellobiose phosphorylase
MFKFQGSYASSLRGDWNDTMTRRRGDKEWERLFFVRRGDE